MSLKRSNSSSQPPIDSTIAQPAKKTKNGSTIVIHGGVWRRIVSYVDSETLPPPRTLARRLAMLEALAKLCEEDEVINDGAFLLEVRKRSQKVLEAAYAAGKTTEEAMLDGVMALGRAYARM
jgi:hypothetical protein